MIREHRCPICTKPLPQCHLAGECDLPHNFAEKCAAAPPLWIATAGFSSHGKTVFLSALSLILDQLGDMLPDFGCVPMNQQTMDRIRDMRAEAKAGEVSGPTQPAQPEPLLFQLDGVPQSEGRSSREARMLVIYDAAGEFFSSLEQLKENVPALPYVSTIWFLVSLKDLKESKEHVTLPDLFQSYQVAMEQEGINLKKRRVIVTYTKAELIQNILPSQVVKYLSDDPFRDLTLGKSLPLNGFSLDEYINEADEISQLLEEFTKGQPGGRQFINMVHRQGMELKFCATSALGQSPDGHTGNLVERATRYRVLDPLFWTLRGGEPPTPNGRKRMVLVLDSSQSSERIYAGGRPQSMWEAMGARGETVSHYLGRMRPVGYAGQQPPSKAAQNKHMRLIGPILDRAPQDSYVLVLSQGKITDLDDFCRTAWRDRLLVGVTEEKDEEIWPHSFVMRDSDDADAIVSRLTRLKEQY